MRISHKTLDVSLIMFKKGNVVMLSTDEKANTIWKATNDQLIRTHVSDDYKEKYKLQHLYITPDDEIKQLP